MEMSLLTDIGKKRVNNQDYINRYENKKGIPLILLADGMGGHRAGNIASEMTVTDLGRLWVNDTIDDLNATREWLIRNLENENEKIHRLGIQEQYKGMGTTIEVLTVIDGHIMYAHVGDSRIALIRDGNYEQLTTDHSLVNELIKAGQLTEDEAQTHPQKNIITQSIGQEQAIEPDINIQLIQPNDYILMCSDGLTNMISSDEIRDVVVSDVALKEKTETLVRFANNAGGSDNITVALIQFDEEDIS